MLWLGLSQGVASKDPIALINGMDTFRSVYRVSRAFVHLYAMYERLQQRRLLITALLPSQSSKLEKSLLLGSHV